MSHLSCSYVSSLGDALKLLADNYDPQPVTELNLPARVPASPHEVNTQMRHHQDPNILHDQPRHSPREKVVELR